MAVRHPPNRALLGLPDCRTRVRRIYHPDRLLTLSIQQASLGRGCVKTRSSFFEPFKINQMATCALVSLADTVILIDHKHRILDFKRPNRFRDAQKIQMATYPIALINPLTPNILINRLKLYASTFKLISVRTLCNVFIRK